jgi:cytochrome c oxidase subunit II
MLFSRPWPLLGMAALLSGCAMPIALNPQGPAAAEMAFLWWVLFWTATVVSIIVFALLFFAVRKARRGEEVEWQESRSTAFVVVGGGIIPAIILIAMLFITLGSMRVFDTPPNPASLTINVTGHMFWWEATYEGEGFTTANEIHIPVGEPVRINLESADVIHSFWVPQLHGKIEMVPGWTNTMYLEADEPGSYFGKCAEFCGIQHANMEFLVIAETPDAFALWLERQRQEAAEPVTELAERGREVFIDSPCALCHTIRGVRHATADVGPDLTHLMSRRTLAARVLENNPGNLGGWIIDPQGIKPGNNMPAVNLPSEDFIALLAYLETLR